MYRKRQYSLVGEKVILVPYSPHHVERYHRWMLDPVLRSQTASEPLSLEQEHQMQLAWLKDEDKCTFIILNKKQYDQKQDSETDCMAGDVNLFFASAANRSSAEIEIMIAEPSCRRKGMGLEALQLMISYGITELNVRVLQAKIGIHNKPSLKLFRERLGFTETSRSAVFQEVTLELVISPELMSHYSDILSSENRWRAYHQSDS